MVPPGREPEFLAPLPIERLWGVGKATAKELQALGIATIGQLQRVTPRALAARLGPHGPDLLELAFGRDARPVEPFSLPKSMGAETTFGRDCRDVARIEETLRAQSERVARELRAEGLAACRVTLKLRWADFRTLTRSRTGDPTQDGLEIYRRAATLLARERLIQPVRLIGVSASTFRPQASGQLPLLDPAAVRRERVARAVMKGIERNDPVVGTLLAFRRFECHRDRGGNLQRARHADAVEGDAFRLEHAASAREQRIGDIVVEPRLDDENARSGDIALFAPVGSARLGHSRLRKN